MSKVKTFSGETAERYALALFELASESSELETIEKKIKSLLEICRGNPDFLTFLKNPTYKIETQQKIFKDISNIMNLNSTLKNFLKFIIIKRRIYFLYKILEKFIKLNAKKKGIIEATLISSKALSNDEKNKISDQISKSIRSNVNFSFSIDKSLISGVRIQVGSLMVENSVSNKLKRIKQTMIEK